MCPPIKSVGGIRLLRNLSQGVILCCHVMLSCAFYVVRQHHPCHASPFSVLQHERSPFSNNALVWRPVFPSASRSLFYCNHRFRLGDRQSSGQRVKLRFPSVLLYCMTDAKTRRDCVAITHFTIPPVIPLLYGAKCSQPAAR